MEATTEVIRRSKTKLQHVLMSNVLFVIQRVFEEKLLVHFEYINLKSIPLPSDAAIALVDKMIFKGESVSGAFLRLLQDTELTDVFPDLKTMPWYQSEEQVSRCEHRGEDKLFCEVERRAVCHVCDSCHHRGHKWLPVEQAVSQLKEQLESDLETLKEKRSKYEDVKKKYNVVVRHKKKQVEATEKQIRAEFEMLHQFLKEDEFARLAALREDEKQKGKIIQSFREQMCSLSDCISAVEQELQKLGVSFLSSYKTTQSSARVHCMLPDPQVASGAMIDVTKHLGNLSFRVWEKMREWVKFTPVILDPNTIGVNLCLSEDLTSVKYDTFQRQFPDNPESFTNHFVVLGSEKLGSGKHSWEVEVGDHPIWSIGVAKESVERKKCIEETPEYGFWCFSQTNGNYWIGKHERIQVQTPPERIRVQLDYDRGEVSFHDAERNTHICTFKDTFSEKLYPCFNSGMMALDAETADVKVCQV